MKLIYAIKDRATDAFGEPLFFMTPAQAMRAFSDAINNRQANNDLNKHPDDYDIYFVGQFNDDNGKIEAAPDLELLARGKDLIQKDN